MKRFSTQTLGALVAVLVLSAVAMAATTVPVKIDFTLPTVACSTVNGAYVVPCDNIPLTGANALTGLDVFISTAPIVDNSTMAPTVSIAAVASTYNSTFQAGDGDTLYIRLKARTAGASSAFSNMLTKDVVVKVVPNSPVIISITVG